MKKFFLCLALCLGLILSCGYAQAENQGAPLGDPVAQFTGKRWLESPDNAKQAFLFGIDTAIAIEAVISERSAAKGPKAQRQSVYPLSPFEKGWMKAFKDVTRAELVNRVNAWYEEHPDSQERPVLDVIWYEIIVPALKAEK